MIAFLFPGQGSQAVGMGKLLCEAFSEAREVIELVDDALEEKLSDVMFNGPMEALSLTRNTQPALMTVSLAAFNVLKKHASKDLKAAYFAGHSLGEYSAHAAIDTFTLQDTARLLRIRGDAMQQAVPVGVGGMAALIGAGGIDQAEALCELVSTGDSMCSVANDNSAEQIVVSGHKTAIEQVVEKASEFGFRRALPLPVSAPFHCALMQPAAEVMQAALENVTVSEILQGKLIANVTCDRVTTGEKAKALLVQQVVGRVRWRETIMKLSAEGVTHFIEVGSGKVLTGLVKRILPEASSYTVETPSDVETVLKEVL
ncbi:MAG: ACP S-malonyltransferase [Candidatus Paracaedibacteraceae bacterium]|nr:ACP S-malonyltransferase [Candidatus Paracaedibacteraceae bacterium]